MAPRDRSDSLETMPRLPNYHLHSCLFTYTTYIPILDNFPLYSWIIFVRTPVMEVKFSGLLKA